MSEIVKCRQCGRRLRERPGLAIPEHVPCAACGSVERELVVIRNESIAVTHHMLGQRRREGRTVGFVETEREGIETAAAELPDGSYRYSLAGTPPQGEADTLWTCKVLIARLNSGGDGPWGAPRVGSGVVDCWAPHTDEASRTLEIQVVRAIVERGMWQNLKRAARISADESVQDLATRLLAAVKKKSVDHRIPRSSRANLVLALDATRTPALAFHSVANHYREQHGGWSSSLGFAAVWVVGPNPSLCHRLDVAAGPRAR